jgi:3-oxoacyl-[acyl-carrier-protein] synthase-3
MGCSRSIGITALGSYVPQDVLTNFDLEKMVDTTDEWIRSRSGIKERHWVKDDRCTSDLAAEGARMALQKAGLQPSQVDLLINSLVSPDMIMPSTACFIHQKLGCTTAPAFDLFAGCTGFVYSLIVGSQMASTGAYDNVLVVGCDLLTKLLDWSDRNTCVLFGDGGGAAVLQPVEEGYGIIAHTMGADGQGVMAINMPGGGTKYPATHETVDGRYHYIKMDGKEVFKFAVKVFADTVVELSEKTGIKLEDVDMVIPHQANNRIIESAVKRLNMPLDKFYSNLERFGNTSAGSIPLALDEALQKGLIKKGDNVFLVGFGAGLTWGGVAMKWAYDYKK